MNSFEIIRKMSFPAYRYCQICEGFITKEEWSELLCSKRHLHKEAHGYRPEQKTDW